MPDLTKEALEAHQKAEAVRKAEEERRAAISAEQARQRAQERIRAARCWAVPILNKTFGYHKGWKLVDLGSGGPRDEVGVEIGEGYDRKVLNVNKNGQVHAQFHVRAVLRYSNNRPYEDVVVRDLEHLGALIVMERENSDYEMRNAD